MSKSSQGLLWSFFGVLILSPDSLLIRLLNLNDFSLIFYRSFLPAVTIFLFRLEVFLLVTKQDTPSSTIEGILGITRTN